MTFDKRAMLAIQLEHVNKLTEQGGLNRVWESLRLWIELKKITVYPFGSDSFAALGVMTRINFPSSQKASRETKGGIFSVNSPPPH